MFSMKLLFLLCFVLAILSIDFAKGKSCSAPALQCQNGGKCVETATRRSRGRRQKAGAQSCQCPSGFVGRRCEVISWVGK